MAINTDNGQLVWNISGMMRNPVIADGLLTVLNSYDGQVYTFGKGPSATTVTAPDIAVPVGTGIMIKGTVTDQSPGQKGTPAISDQDMTAWMEYLYIQKPMPTNAKGVQVKISVIGSDGVEQILGTATSDASGNFGFAWTPQTQGQYQIKATFEGTESYGNSHSTTYVMVSPAQGAVITPTIAPTTTPIAPPTTTPTITTSPSVVPHPEQTTGTEIYIIVAAAVIIIAVIIAAVVLKRRK